MKTRICPKCGGKDFTLILQGDADSEKKPFWQCDDCLFRFDQDDTDNIDSFDYDQGFNLDEVYDL